MALPGLVAAKNLADVTDRERAWDSLGLNINADTPFDNRLAGIPLGGGYFAGLISHTADGNATHALIVAPKSGEFSGGPWKTSLTITPGASSSFDGFQNTQAIIAAGISNFPIANACVNFRGGGFTDWYLPAALELEIAYRAFKPSTASNNLTSGVNPYAVPTATGTYSANVPGQTLVSNFKEGQADAFLFVEGDKRYWSSTEINAASASAVIFSDGTIFGLAKNNNPRMARPFRRIALDAL